ncbi:MAG: phospholipase A [Prevotellaceae bacterium]|nr:phospholipase A [Prevotellaceae bacterium]
MKEKLKFGGIIIVCVCLSVATRAQDRELREALPQQPDTGKFDFKKPLYMEIEENEIINLLDRQPNFGIYHDNYLITGIPTNKGINKYTADAKFQISIRQRLFKSLLPFNTILFLTYTQKSFWNIYEHSFPFKDNNYNPGLVFIKPVIHENQLRGVFNLALEHESNGKDSLESRGWNHLVLSGVYFFNPCFSVQAKLWTGFLDRGEKDLNGGGNPDLYKYRGYGLVAFYFRSLDDRFLVSATINPRNKIGRFNTELELNVKLNSKANQYFFIQWYNGYGESLLEYNRYSSMLRAGIAVKPPLRSLH